MGQDACGFALSGSGPKGRHDRRVELPGKIGTWFLSAIGRREILVQAMNKRDGV